VGDYGSGGFGFICYIHRAAEFCGSSEPVAGLPKLPVSLASSQRRRTRVLPAVPFADNFLAMSSVAEIESAIARLSRDEVAELAAWLEEYQQMINASAEVFSIYDKEEGE
jgi:hypothetical protein